MKGGREEEKKGGGEVYTYVIKGVGSRQLYIIDCNVRSTISVFHQI